MLRLDEPAMLSRERARSGRVGVVRNPNSRRNQKPAEPWWREFAHPDLIRAEPESAADVAAVLADFARQEVSLVVADGGDGTVRDVLTALPEAFGGELPAMAVLASGTTNLIAADVGAGRSDAASLSLLAEIARHGPQPRHLQPRPVLEARWSDGSHPTVRGMFLGAANFSRATDLSVRLVRQGRIDEGAGVAATILTSIAQTLAGPERELWMRGESLGLALDGGQASHGARFIVLATTLNRLMLGLWPFWGEGQGGLRWLDVDAPPKRLAVALPAIMRGKPWGWMEEAGYRSGVARSLDLHLDAPFVIDGESYAPGPSGRVAISAGPMVDFIVP